MQACVYRHMCIPVRAHVILESSSAQVCSYEAYEHATTTCTRVHIDTLTCASLSPCSASVLRLSARCLDAEQCASEATFRAEAPPGSKPQDKGHAICETGRVLHISTTCFLGFQHPYANHEVRSSRLDDVHAVCQGRPSIAGGYSQHRLL